MELFQALVSIIFHLFIHLLLQPGMAEVAVVGEAAVISINETITVWTNGNTASGHVTAVLTSDWLSGVDPAARPQHLRPQQWLRACRGRPAHAARLHRLHQLHPVQVELSTGVREISKCPEEAPTRATKHDILV